MLTYLKKIEYRYFVVVVFFVSLILFYTFYFSAEDVCELEGEPGEMVMDLNNPQDSGINNQGLRSSPITDEGDNETRILVLGDGFTYQHRMDKSQRFTEKAERTLEKQLEEDVSVINAGIRGAGMEDYYLYLYNRGLEFEPDVVIAVFTSRNERSYSDRENITRYIMENYGIDSADKIEDNFEVKDRYDELLQESIEKGKDAESSEIIRYGNMIEAESEEHGFETYFYLIEPEEQQVWRSKEGLEIEGNTYSSVLDYWEKKCGINLISPPQEILQDADLHSNSTYTLDGGDLNEKANKKLAEKLVKELSSDIGSG